MQDGKKEVDEAVIEREFSLRELVEIAQVSPLQADYWARAGLISNVAQAPGSGRHRRFSFKAALEATLIGELVRHFSLSTIKAIVSEVHKRLARQNLSVYELVCSAFKKPPIEFVIYFRTARTWDEDHREREVSLPVVLSPLEFSQSGRTTDRKPIVTVTLNVSEIAYDAYVNARRVAR